MNQKTLQDSSPTNQETNADYLFSLKHINPKQTSKLDVELTLTHGPDHELGYPRLGPVKSYLLYTFYPCKPEFMEEPENLVCGAIEFGHLVERQLQEKEEMYAPSNPTRYCQVCKIYFDSYTDHITQREHKEKLRKSRGTQFIRGLSERFKQSNDPAKKVPTGTLNTKQGQCIDCDEGEDATENERRLLLKDCYRNDELLREN